MNNRRARARLGFLGWMIVAALGLAVPVTRAAPDEPSIPAPVGFVNDVANVIDEPTRAKLEAFLNHQLKAKTGVDFAILTVPTTAPLDPSTYKVKVFEQWKLGQKGQDTGLLLLVALEEREARFETGYGLEGTLPDGLQSRIFRELMAPRFRENDYAGGIVAAVLECSRRIAKEKNVTLEWNGEELRYDEDEGGTGLPWWVWPLLFLLLVMVLGRLSRGNRGRWGGGGWGGGLGGWGGYGGGFGGGGWGGGFGGGGFGGSGGGSFGGFGGGSSGGGGGGGKW